MSAATDAIRAELETARRDRIALGAAREDANGEVKAALAKRQAFDEEQRENQDRIEALEKALELLDPGNNT